LTVVVGKPSILGGRVGKEEPAKLSEAAVHVSEAAAHVSNPAARGGVRGGRACPKPASEKREHACDRGA